MNEKYAAIIQARLNSSRLPGKMIRDIDKETSLMDVILERVLIAFPPERVVLATTTSGLDDQLEEVAERYSINVFRGDEDDVISRFIEAADNFNAEHILRVCADNPLLQPELLQKVLEVGMRSGADYVSYRFSDGTPVIKSHIGLFAEYCSAEALRKVVELTSDSFYHEHVTNYIHAHPELFDLQWLPVPTEIDSRSDIRLTIDSEADFQVMKSLYNELSRDYSISNIIKTIDLNPDYLKVMKAEIAANSK